MGRTWQGEGARPEAPTHREAPDGCLQARLVGTSLVDSQSRRSDSVLGNFLHDRALHSHRHLPEQAVAIQAGRRITANTPPTESRHADRAASEMRTRAVYLPGPDRHRVLQRSLPRTRQQGRRQLRLRPSGLQQAGRPYGIAVQVRQSVLRSPGRIKPTVSACPSTPASGRGPVRGRSWGFRGSRPATCRWRSSSDGHRRGRSS